MDTALDRSIPYLEGRPPVVHDLIAGILWTTLGVSLVLTIGASFLRSWKMLLAAGLLALVVAIPALPSIGLFILPVAIAEIVLALIMRRMEQRREQHTP